MNWQDLKAGHGQTLFQHLYEVENFCGEKARLLGFLHDIGKVSKTFQEYLNAMESGKMPDAHFRHAVASLPMADYILQKQNEPDNVRLLKLLAIYYHHSTINPDMLENDLIRVTNAAPIFSLSEGEIRCAFSLLQTLFSKKGYEWKGDVGEFLKRMKEKGGYTAWIEEILKKFFTRFQEIDEETKFHLSDMYYRLVKGDWLSSSGKEEEKINWSYFLSLFESNFWSKRQAEDPRSQIQNTLLKAENDFVYFIAPTGSGKSEASLYWALQKAREHGTERIIYVLPFKALIDDLYSRFSKKYLPGKVMLWHSDYLEYLLEELNRELSFKSFDEFNFFRTFRKYFLDPSKPIIITTADQILMSFLNVARYPIRRGLFENSVFVFDEIQAYGAFMRGFIYDFIPSVKPKACLFMTATPPGEVLGNGKVVIENPFGTQIEFEIVEDKAWVELLHKERDCDLLFDRELLKESEKQKQDKNKAKKNNKILYRLKELVEKNAGEYARICVMVNTIERAKDLYAELKKTFKDRELILLHSNLIKEDRDTRLSRILDSSGSKPFIAVSTQVLEAGVDVSFDLLIREMAPLPDLVQAIGRVNRFGRFQKAKAVIVLFPVDDKTHLPYSKSEMMFVEDVLKSFDSLRKVDFEVRMDALVRKATEMEFENEKERQRFYAKVAGTLIWSVKSIDALLGTSLRRELITKPVFVESMPGERNLLLEKLREIKQMLRKGKGNVEELLKEYLRCVMRLQGNVISLPAYQVKSEVISKEEYIKHFAEPG